MTPDPSLSIQLQLLYFLANQYSTLMASYQEYSTNVILFLGQNSQTLQAQVLEYPSLIFQTTSCDISNEFIIISCFCNYSSFTKMQFLYNFNKHLYTKGGYYCCFNVALFNQLWFRCNLLLLCEMLKSTQDPNRILQKHFLFAAGTLIAELHITFHSWSFLNCIT